MRTIDVTANGGIWLAPGESRPEAKARELERLAGPAVERPTYATPTRVLHRHDPDAPALEHASVSTPGIPQAANPNPRPSEPAVMMARGSSESPAAEVTADPSECASAGGASTSEALAREELSRMFPDAQPEVPISALAQAFAMVVTAVDSLDAEPAVYFHQGSDFVLLDMLKNQLAYLPDLSHLKPQAKIEEAIAGDPEATSPEEQERLRTILRKHQSIFLGEGNALPTRGEVCDLDKPVSQRARRIPGEPLLKVYELLKRLLETGLIEYSESAWASPIVIVMKKNGKDIRMCINYRLVNQLIKLMNYPLPLIDELMSSFSATMSSGHWTWLVTSGRRLPFGLKNAPLINQHFWTTASGALCAFPERKRVRSTWKSSSSWGFSQWTNEIKPEPITKARYPRARSTGGRWSPGPARTRCSIRTGSPRSRWGPVLFRARTSTTISTELRPGMTCVKTLDALFLYRLQYCNISVSLPKSEFGVKKCKYLGHDISSDGIRTPPKLAQKVIELPFPGTLKGIQSFLGSLNYYTKFIKDLPVIAARDGSGGAACILWNLPSWEIIAAQGQRLEKATVNEAKYAGLIKGMLLALGAEVQELVVVSDSRLAIQQLQGPSPRCRLLVASVYVATARGSLEFLGIGPEADVFVTTRSRARGPEPPDDEDPGPSSPARSDDEEETAKGLPRNPGSSPGNMLATRPFQVVSMDFVIPLPRTSWGNEALLLF
ncbi:unnamed protein product [Phytophthora lilii]|uniref:Unnamed protein product n=1 Tax=Phytophthora lilii TaxID=2077276 RepID=A0A9W6UCQ4_9STRA|nr:unnamed protein product [Phytophthora lilii]